MEHVFYYKFLPNFLLLKDYRRISGRFEITQLLLSLTIELVKHFQR